MPDSNTISSENELINIDLRNPILAAFLTWLLPGLGHFYQRRYHKAIIFFLCIVPTFIAGCALASSSEVGKARNVYWSWRWREDDLRLWWLLQAPLAIAAVPSWIQAMHVHSGYAPPFGSFMAPPRLFHGDKKGISPTADEIWQKLPHFELATYFTVLAGLMNLLVILDALDGPFVRRKHEETVA